MVLDQLTKLQSMQLTTAQCCFNFNIIDFITSRHFPYPNTIVTEIAKTYIKHFLHFAKFNNMMISPKMAHNVENMVALILKIELS